MSLLRSISKARIFRAGLFALTIGWTPALLYIAYEELTGATGGNPIGLGLLMAISTPVALVLVVVGLIQGVCQYTGLTQPK